MKKAPATREEIAVLAKNAGLDLAPEYFDELVEAYASIEQMLMRVRRGRNRADEPAHVMMTGGSSSARSGAGSKLPTVSRTSTPRSTVRTCSVSSARQRNACA
jgi:hypothetical protein